MDGSGGGGGWWVCLIVPIGIHWVNHTVLARHAAAAAATQE